MADLKPIGSEKLQGDEKIKRILELAYYKESKNNTSKMVSPELVSESKVGGVYGIVKEKDSYYVKRGLNESTLDYIGGMFMKNKNKFSSYAEALKRLEYLKGQEELQEATKYVLKNKSSMEDPSLSSEGLPPAPVEEPSTELPPAPAEEPSSELPPAPAEEPSDLEGMDSSMDSEDTKRSDYMAEVQKYSGKLGQELRDQKDRMESDDIKYVLNMVISAVDLDRLDDEDIEEIGKKFEREEEPKMGGEEVSSEEPEMSAEVPSEDLSEMGGMDALETFINTPIQADEIDLSSYADIDELMTMDFSDDNEDDEDMDDEDLQQYVDSDEEFRKLAQQRYLSLSQQVGPKEAKKRMFNTIDQLKRNTPMDDNTQFDLDEITNSVNKAVGETLSKYFK